MRNLLGIFIILVVVSHETIFAKGGPGGFHHTKCCNVPEPANKAEFFEKMKEFNDACRQELGITGRIQLYKTLFKHERSFNIKLSL